MLNAAIDEAIVMTDGSDDGTVVGDMIEVRGTQAATVARENARAAALAGQAARRSPGSGCSGHSSAAGWQRHRQSRAEATLFQVARAWERAAGTDQEHPPLM
jgi:hypothetical protein